MSKMYLMFFLLLLGCGCKVTKSDKKFDVVSSFNRVVFSTNDELQAYQRVYHLNLMGRNFALKSCYFVICNEKNNQKSK